MRQLYSFYFDAFWIALKSILEHKLRAFLTLIGIIIGVAAVVVVGASISGLKTYVVDKVAKVLGANHFMITRMASTGRMSDDEFERKNRLNKKVVWDEYLYVRDKCKNCLYVGAEVGANADLMQDGIEMPSTQIFGSTDNMYDITDKTLEEGRFFNAEEVTRAANVCVIGMDVKDKFFPNQFGARQNAQAARRSAYGSRGRGKARFVRRPVDGSDDLHPDHAAQSDCSTGAAASRSTASR